MVTHVQADDIPEWVIAVIHKLAKQEGMSLEQASRMLIFQGALHYEAAFTSQEKS